MDTHGRREAEVKDRFSISGTGEFDLGAQLRKRLDEVGSIFEFLIMALDRDVPIDMAVHKQALKELQLQIRTSQLEWHRKIVETLPVGSYSESEKDWDSSKVVGRELSRLQIRRLVKVSEAHGNWPSLFRCFCDPLCFPGESDGRAVRLALFAEWVDNLGLADWNEVTVLNWTQPISQPSSDEASSHEGCTPWANFFYSGSQLQPVWCLTIWHPGRRTMAVLLAC